LMGLVAVLYYIYENYLENGHSAAPSSLKATKNTPA
jgi:hypothetical protein